MNCNTESSAPLGLAETTGSAFQALSSVQKAWRVEDLCRAIAQALESRLNPVHVVGELSGFSRASSGHCYFNLKGDSAQIRCAMFRRAAALLNFSPHDGDLVELRGRLGVYEARGDLQLIVESLSQAGQGALFEQFVRLKAKLEAQGLFDPAKKRVLAAMPRAIGVVSSLGAAAWHDVVTVLRRRVPHIPVVMVPASVQGPNAPRELQQALAALYQLTEQGSRESSAVAIQESGRGRHERPVIDVILLVRGGGSAEDLWAFNDEQLAHAMARSPVPIVSGVGHETDFTIADFVADLRAPTPTAAAELVAQPQQNWLAAIEALKRRLSGAALSQLDKRSQLLDLTMSRLGRPSAVAARQRLRLASKAQQLHYLTIDYFRKKGQALEGATMRLESLDPNLVLRRGYAWLTDTNGKTISSVHQARRGQTLHATLTDGKLELTVSDSK